MGNLFKKRRLSDPNQLKSTLIRIALIDLIISLIISLMGCDWDSPAHEIAQLGRARPQAITYLDHDTLVVSDVAYREGRWGEGRIVFLNPQQNKRYGAWFTPITNPQRIQVNDDHIAVVSSGEIDLSGLPQGTWSALSLLSRDQPFHEPQSVIWRAESRGSFLIDVVDQENPPSSDESPVDDPHLYALTSGLDGVIWQASMTQSTTLAEDAEDAQGSQSEQATTQTITQATLNAIRYAPTNELSLGTLARWGAKILIVDFNTDQLTFLNEQGEIAPCSPELGRFEGVMEGAQTPRVLGDKLWVSFGLSGRMIDLDLSALDLNHSQCEITPQEYDPPLGQVPNDLIVTQQWVYVLHTAENAIWVYDRSTRRRQAIWALPAQTNPWNFALSPDQTTLAVTEWARGGITLVNTRDGSLQGMISEELLAPPPTPYCWWSDEPTADYDAHHEAWEITAEGLEFSWSALSISSISSKSLSNVSNTDLQGAPQLALLLAPESAPIRLEVQFHEGDVWRPLPIAQFSKDVQSTPNEVAAQQTEELTLSTSPMISSSDQKISRPILQDPCSLFDPLHREQIALEKDLKNAFILRLPLTPALLASETSNLTSDSEWGSAHTQAGRVPIHQIRISSTDPTRSAWIWASAYRHW